jgi:cell division protein FtsW
MVISAFSWVWITHGFGAFVFEIVKVTAFIALGFFLMIVIRNRFSLNATMRFIKPLSIIILVTMLSTLLFEEVNGAQRWIRIPGFTLQPVEFLKVFLVLFLSYHFGRHYKKDVKPSKVIKLPIILTVVIFVFVAVFQGDLGSALILVMIALCMFLAFPEKKYNGYKLTICSFMLISVVAFYLFGSTLAEWIYAQPEDFPGRARLMRLAILFDPLYDVFVSGFQLTNALVALMHGGVFGMGIGNSTTKFILPEPSNDAILAVIAEETGLIGVGIVFILYFYIVSRLLNYAKYEQINIYDRLILIGIASFFMAQFFTNVGGMIGLIPMTGVTLLFVSSGGTSIMSAFIAMGIAQGVIKRYIK